MIWWVEYKYTYDLWLYDNEDTGGWKMCEGYDARRFLCRKRDIPRVVEWHIREELENKTIRNLKVKITGKYITTN